MSSAPDSAASERVVPAGYELVRGLFRIWFKLFFRKIRVLEPDHLPASGAALLLIGHPPSFLDALVLISAFDRPVNCLLDPQLVQSGWARFLARRLGMIPEDADAASFDAVCGVAERGGVLLVFAHLEKAEEARSVWFGRKAARLALEVNRRLTGPASLAIVPVHVFMPVAQLDSLELLVHMEPPLRWPPGDGAPPETDAQTDSLAGALEAAFHNNVFRLRPVDLRHFLADLEDVLRVELEQEWSAKPGWKQKLDGFALSEFVGEWAGQENFLNPGRLVAIRDQLDSYREKRRALSLRELEMESCGPWIKSVWRRGAAWLETVVGLPVGLFGLLNHLPAMLVLKAAGWFRWEGSGPSAGGWFARAAVVAGFYAAQILACDAFWGRSAAGAYAVFLPLSGLYLWRFRWLVVNRSRLLAWKAWDDHTRGRLGQARRELIRQLNRARDAYAEWQGVVH